MAVLRTDIEKALDEIISHEEGMRFQGIAIVLVKQKWPELIACERKKDLGLDAHANALLAHDGVGKGVASSITATYEKVKTDAQTAKQNFKGLGVLIFATPRKVTNEMAAKWKDDLRKDTQLELVLITREDVITSLLIPSNAPICSSQLRIPVLFEPEDAQSLKAAQEASAETASAWMQHSRLTGRPLIELSAVELDADGSDQDAISSLRDIQEKLNQGRRLILEAPAGSGKTTTLMQLAKSQSEDGRLALLVDLPDWVRSNNGILDFVAAAPQFASRNIAGAALAKISRAAHISFLLNGWNEISDKHEDDAVRVLAELERNFPSAGIIVATRSHAILPPLPGASRLRLRRISPAQRREYLSQRLNDRADALRQQIESSSILHELTLTPMILSEVTTLFELGKPLPNTKYEIMDAVTSALEQTEHHRGALARPPLCGLAREYLIDLAKGMTAARTVRLEDQVARRTVAATSDRLMRDNLISERPDQATVLAQLCAHHVLVRTDYPSLAFRFEHQQIQEFFASRFLARELRQALLSVDARTSFMREYVNWPVWEEPLSMLAEHVGQLSLRNDASDDAIKEGCALLEMALYVDPIFAGELAHRCGPVIWKVSGPTVSKRFRDWHGVNGGAHKACAVEAMLATGAPDFSDILLPLFRSDDQQQRLRTYRFGGHFHLSSLGAEWLASARNWSEGQRADLFAEAIHAGGMASEARTILDGEKSPTVKQRVIEALNWYGDDKILEECLASLDDEAFALSIQHVQDDEVPPSLRPRAIAVHRAKLDNAATPFDRLQLLKRLDNLGAPDVMEEMKATLESIRGDRLQNNEHHLLRHVLERIAAKDGGWVSEWVATRVQSGSLWSDHWEEFIRAAQVPNRDTVFEDYASRKLDHREASGALAVLANGADIDFSSRVFDKICSNRRAIVNPRAPESRTAWEIHHQLETLYKRLSKNVAVGGMLKSVAGEFDALQFQIAGELIGYIGREPTEYPAELGPEMTEALRIYFKGGVGHVLAGDDFAGDEKRSIALTLARLGKAEDIADIERLVDADIKRMVTGREARARREQGPKADGATMIQTSWYIVAIEILDAPESEALFFRLLKEPTYESEAANALVRRARRVTPANRFAGNKLDVDALIAARESPIEFFDPTLKERYSKVIRERIDVLFEERAASEKPEQIEGRLKSLGFGLAILDGKNQAAVILRILVFPGKWDGWNRARTLGMLLEAGVIPTLDDVNRALDPVFVHFEQQGWMDDNARMLLCDCLCIYPFVSEPAKGIEKMRALMTKFKLAGHSIGEVAKALGKSRNDDALTFLQDIQAGGGVDHVRHEFVEALISLDTPRSRQLFVDLIDPTTGELPMAQYAATHHDDRIPAYLAALAASDATIKAKLIDFSTKSLSPIKRGLLARVLSRMGTTEAVIASLNLIDDQMRPEVPHGVWQGIENIFVERRAADSSGSSFALVPRDANEVRRKLLDILQTDEKRKRTALDLIGETERLRQSYGRPIDEERHPALTSNVPWPPI